MSVSGQLSLRAILQRHEEQLIDFEKNICLLCKRCFSISDQLNKHRSLSQYHLSRLKRLRKRLFTDEQVDRIERKEREALYRDRAKERRQKFGIDDKLVKIENPYNDHKNEHSNKKGPHQETSVESSFSQMNSDTAISKDNKGAALLSKMGWREGTGLGKSNQGMTGIIKLNAQIGTSGLGSKQNRYKVDPNASYKDAVKQVMLQRYYELSSEDEVDDKHS